MAKLFLLRHFKSQWNLENRFSGWTDMPISQDGKKDAVKKAEDSDAVILRLYEVINFFKTFRNQRLLRF